MSPASSATPNLDSTYSSAFLLALSTEAGSPCAVSKSTYLCKVIHCEEDIASKLFWVINSYLLKRAFIFFG